MIILEENFKWHLGAFTSELFKYQSSRYWFWIHWFFTGPGLQMSTSICNFCILSSAKFVHTH